MIHRIIVEDNCSFDTLKKHIENGAKFIVYRYTISLFLAITFNRFSSAYLVLPNELPQKVKNKYNFITFIFGWWAIRRGISNAIHSIRLNNSGGMDVTKDIMLNLTEEQFYQRLVEIKEIYEKFMKPDKYELQAFKQTLLKDFADDPRFECCYVGVFIDTEKDEIPNLVVGVSTDEDITWIYQELQTSLYKKFYRQVGFEFINLKDDDELSKHLMEEGCRLF